MTANNASSVAPDLTDPIWTIEHIARCFRLSDDRARDYTSRDDFPAARRLGDSAAAAPASPVFLDVEQLAKAGDTATAAEHLDALQEGLRTAVIALRNELGVAPTVPIQCGV